MNKLDIFQSELLNMLKITKNHIKREKDPLFLVDKNKFGRKGSKKEKKLNPKRNTFKKKAKNVPADMTCYHYGKMGYWKNNCQSFLAKMNENASIAHKDMYMIYTIFSLSSSASNSWVLDTACGSYRVMMVKESVVGDVHAFLKILQ